MEEYNIYIQVLSNIGVPALISLFVAEKIKNKNAKEISKFQTEITHLKSKESFKFTKLHEKRFEVMAETYKYLTDALFKLRIYVSPLKGIPTDKTVEEVNYAQFSDYSNAHNKFYEYYSFNKIYFNDEIEELLEKYFTSSTDIFNQYIENEFVNREGAVFNSKVFMSAAIAYKKIPELIEPIQLEIKNKFRELLGE